MRKYMEKSGRMFVQNSLFNVGKYMKGTLGFFICRISMSHISEICGCLLFQ